jgi:hypothetical protein
MSMEILDTTPCMPTGSKKVVQQPLRSLAYSEASVGML